MWKPPLNSYQPMKHEQQDIDPTPMEDHPSVEKRDLHPKDKYLRKEGFKIVSRPKIGPNLWEKDAKVYTQEEAEKTTGVIGVY